MKNTVKSILSAMLSAAIVGAAQYQQGGGTSVKGTGVIAGVGALVGLANYFAQSPIVKPPAPADVASQTAIAPGK
jgi:hypothetical protein